jgi:hypothetical protein
MITEHGASMDITFFPLGIATHAPSFKSFMSPRSIYIGGTTFSHNDPVQAAR